MTYCLLHLRKSSFMDPEQPAILRPEGENKEISVHKDPDVFVPGAGRAGFLDACCLLGAECNNQAWHRLPGPRHLFFPDS